MSTGRRSSGEGAREVGASPPVSSTAYLAVGGMVKGRRDGRSQATRQGETMERQREGEMKGFYLGVFIYGHRDSPVM